MRHELTSDELNAGRAKGGAPEARRKYAETMERYYAEDKEAVRILRERGMVPLAIADALGLSNYRVRRCLVQLVREGALDPITANLSVSGPKEA
jgi:hypothetical protein